MFQEASFCDDPEAADLTGRRAWPSPDPMPTRETRAGHRGRTVGRHGTRWTLATLYEQLAAAQGIGAAKQGHDGGRPLQAFHAAMD